MTMRDELFAHIKTKYRTDPEYLWTRFPGYAVFRHADNDKLFAMVMDVPKVKLGLAGEAVVDILILFSIKIGDHPETCVNLQSSVE